MSVSLNAATFYERLQRLYSYWERSRLLKEVDAFYLTVGRLPENAMYSKSTAMQLYFFAYEFTDMMIVFAEKELILHTTAKKIEILKQLESQRPDDLTDFKVKLTYIAIDKSDYKSSFEGIWEKIISSKGGKKIGFVKKDDDLFTGNFFSAFTEFIKEKESEEWEKVDVNNPLSAFMGLKENTELVIMKRAANLSADIMENYFRPEIEKIILDDKQTKMDDLADKVDDCISEPSKKVNTRVNVDLIESCYHPIINSYKKGSSPDDMLKFGIITCSFGARYKNYCTNVARTFFVDPSEELSAQYKLLLSIRSHVLKKLVAGTEINSLYETAVQVIEKSNFPDLIKYLSRNLGSGIGIEFRESALALTKKNQKTIKTGMIFNLSIAFKDIEGEDGFKYTLMIADTVVVREAENHVLTEQSTFKLGDVVYTLESENGADKNKENKRNEFTNRKTSSKVLESRTRQQDKIGLVSEAAQLREQQEEISKKMHEKAKIRLLQNQGKDVVESFDARAITAYGKPTLMPNDTNIRKCRIFLDKDKWSLILPIFGGAIPFHISMIKNCSVNSFGEVAELRINFHSPGVSINNHKVYSLAPTDSAFVRELVFHSTLKKRLQEIQKEIAAFVSNWKSEENRRKELADLIVQDRLEINKGKSNPRLNGLFIRPQYIRGRSTGILEAHENGFRYIVKGQKVDILYNNIRHAFFQPCNHEMIVLIHFHLKYPIMNPYKKKTLDIQFYTEVMDATQDLSARGNQSYGDSNEMEAEARERKLRNQLNRLFKSFTDKVSQITFDMPIRKLGFHGVPKNSSVFLMPTADCLVSLIDQPFTIYPLGDIEIAHFERVTLSGKNFDIVFINKDYKTWSRITAIESSNMDLIKAWLTQCEIKYYEAKNSINWTTVLKDISEDYESFFESGGWDVLDENNNASESESEGEKEQDYVPSESEEEFSESDFNEEDSYDSEEDSEEASGSGEGSSEESGQDWDELEKQAIAEDRQRHDTTRKRTGRDDSEDERRSKKKRRK